MKGVDCLELGRKLMNHMFEKEFQAVEEVAHLEGKFGLVDEKTLGLGLVKKADFEEKRMRNDHQVELI